MCVRTFSQDIIARAPEEEVTVVLVANLYMGNCGKFKSPHCSVSVSLQTAQLLLAQYVSSFPRSLE